MSNDQVNKAIDSACNGGFSKSTKTRIAQKLRERAEQLSQEIIEAQEIEAKKKPISVFNPFKK